MKMMLILLLEMENMITRLTSVETNYKGDKTGKFTSKQAHSLFLTLRKSKGLKKIVKLTAQEILDSC